VKAFSLLLRLLPVLIEFLPQAAGLGRHAALRLTARAGVVLAIAALAGMAVLAGVAAMVMGLAESLGYPAALGLSAAVLLAVAGILVTALALYDQHTDRRAAAAREASIEALVGPLNLVGRSIGARPLQSVLLALAVGAAIGLMRRR
jgi:hypothetical protein